MDQTPSSTSHPAEAVPPQTQAPSPNPPPPAAAATTFSATPSSPSLPPSPSTAPPPVTTSPSPSLPQSTNPSPSPTTPPATKPPTPTPAATQSQTQPPRPSLPVAASPSTFSRPWQQPSYTHFSLPPSPTPPLPSSNPPSSPSMPAGPRGGMAIGVPAHHASPPQPSPTSFSPINPPPFGQKFGGLGRNVPDSVPSSSSSQVRQPIQGMQGMGMMGTLGSSSSMGPAGVPGHQFRAAQSSLRPPNSPNVQSPNTQNFQGHGMLRAQSVASSGSSSPNTPQSPHPQNQPWLSSGTQGKPPRPPPTLRPQVSPQSLQQRAHIPQQQQQQHQQQHPTMPTTPQQQLASTSQQVQQASLSNQSQEQFGQHYATPRAQTSAHQQQMARGQGVGIQRPPSAATLQPSVSPPVAPSRTSVEETGESSNRILSKRTIHELLNQIDPSEKLDTDVEDILVDIAEEFVDSITTFGCSLAKHRKSSVLEAKDILLHLERNWHITLPGFSGDEIKTFKKPLTNDLHKERLAAVKRSIVAGEVTNLKGSAGQGGGNAKSHSVKGPLSILGSPNPKIREAA